MHTWFARPKCDIEFSLSTELTFILLMSAKSVDELIPRAKFAYLQEWTHR